jgi:predicted lipoprotein
MKLGYVFTLLLILPLSGCGSSSDTAAPAEIPDNSGESTDTCNVLKGDNFNCATMLKDITTVALQTVTSVKTSLVQLETDITSYCAAQDTVTLVTAKAQWATTLAAVQQLEVMQFDVIDSARDNFYNWPLNDTCKVDLQIASGATTDISTVATGRRGLNAIEYILFEEDTLSRCAVTFGAVSSWVTENSLDVRKKARCDYAKVVTIDLVSRAVTLEQELSSLDLATKYDSLQAAANRISDALFYVDKQTKDAKIISVLPQTEDADFKATSLESQFAHLSKAHLQNNLLGARAIFTANDQTGLEDYLIAAGQTSLATDMLAALDAATATLESIEGDLHTAVSNASSQSACINSAVYVAGDSDITKLCVLQKNLKTFTDLLKEDFVMVLKFTKPAAADGDND